MKNSTKKRVLTGALVVALVALIGGASLAYFTDSESADNVFTVGDVNITLTEPNWDADAAIADPGKAIAKDPTVTNVGSNAAWIRVNVTCTDAAAFTAAAAAHNITDLATIFGGFQDSAWTLAGTSADTAADTLTYSYYFNTALAPEASTGALFTSVTVPAAFTSAEMAALGNDFTITVQADAIQATGFDTPAAAFAAFDVQAG